MQILKRILLGLGVIIVLVLVVAIFLPSRAVVSRTIEVEKPIKTVFDFTADYNNYAKWNAWSALDPEAKSKVTGNGGEVGQIYEWEGNLIGKGTLTLKKIEPYNLIQGELIFLTPMPGEAEDTWKFEPLENSTRIIWTFETNLSYPIGRFLGLMMDSQLGPQLEEGLWNLKNAVEKLPEPADSTETK